MRLSTEGQEDVAITEGMQERIPPLPKFSHSGSDKRSDEYRPGAQSPCQEQPPYKASEHAMALGQWHCSHVNGIDALISTFGRLKHRII